MALPLGYREARGAATFRRSVDAACPDTSPRLSSGPVYLEAAADGCGDGLQVAWVRADHKVVAAYGSLHHARVDDVGGGGAGRYRADGAGLPVVEGLHVASS